MMTIPLLRLRGSDGLMHRTDAWQNKKCLMMFVDTPTIAEVHRAKKRLTRFSEDFVPKGYVAIVFCDAPDDIFRHHAPDVDDNQLWLHDPAHRFRDAFFEAFKDGDRHPCEGDCTVLIDETGHITQTIRHQGPPIHLERYGDR